ncbi:hypothetical protein [uncultured Piscinibacter sp.]|uniref:hypothetical protein n=1 Tax=uncultured Piscinibacter sp. TaxID=1131835 RepID=UPI002623A1E9|nr:hypothetical protein [uncultured Piscinibacter sp.]
MYLVAIAWGYVVLMMAVAEATSPNGTVLGAVFTVLLYGVLPLSIVLYVLGTPARKRARRAAEAANSAASLAAVQPDRGDHAPGQTVAPVRKEP